MAKHRRACELRHTVTIQKTALEPDGSGGFDTVWVKVSDVRAAINPLSGSESLRAMQLEEKVTHRVTIRYRSGLTAAMRLLFGTRIFNIRAIINPMERNRWLELLCDEGVAS